MSGKSAIELIPKEVYDYISKYWKERKHLVNLIEKNELRTKALYVELSDLLEEQRKDLVPSKTGLTTDITGIINQIYSLNKYALLCDNTELYGQLSRLEKKYNSYINEQGFSLNENHNEIELYKFLNGLE